jgi:hypothetical protein
MQSERGKNARREVMAKRGKSPVQQSFEAVERGLLECKMQLLQLAIDIEGLPPGPERIRLQKEFRPLWDDWFGAPEAKFERGEPRSTWDYTAWKSEAIQQAELAKKYLAAGRSDLALKAQILAYEAERGAQRSR